MNILSKCCGIELKPHWYSSVQNVQCQSADKSLLVHYCVTADIKFGATRYHCLSPCYQHITATSLPYADYDNIRDVTKQNNNCQHLVLSLTSPQNDVCIIYYFKDMLYYFKNMPQKNLAN